MLLDYTYREGIRMKVGHISLKDLELNGSCFVCYSLLIIYGGTNRITSIGVLHELER